MVNPSDERLANRHGIFDHDFYLRARDGVHNIALAVLGAMLGLNASKLPDNHDTFVLIMKTFSGVFLFFILMMATVRLAELRKIFAMQFIFFSSIAVMTLILPILSESVGNISVVQGIFWGWAGLTAAFCFEAAFRGNDQDLAKRNVNGETEHD